MKPDVCRNKSVRLGAESAPSHASGATNAEASGTRQPEPPLPIRVSTSLDDPDINMSESE